MLVPGFTQTAASWDGVTRSLAGAPHDVVALDVPRALDFPATAAAIGEAGGQAAYVGYSMGGRLALRLALDAPGLVETLVLVSASPGIADERERAARRAADEELAAGIERDGVDAFLERWLAQPMFAGVPPDAPGLDARRSFTAADLAGMLRRLGTGVQEPLWDRLGDLAMPVVLVTGRGDTKFDGIAAAMAERVPHAARLRLPGGHALPLEQPEALAAAIGGFLAGR